MNKIMLCVSLLFFCFFSAYAGLFPLDFFKKQAPHFFVSEFAAKKQQLASATEELTREQQAGSVFEKQLKQEELAVKKQLTALAKGEPTEITQKKQAILEENKQIIGEKQRWHKQITTTLKKIIEDLNKYIDNPSFTDMRGAEKALYTINELYQVAQKFYDASEELAECKNVQKRVNQEYQQVIQQLENLSQELKQKEAETKTSVSSKQNDIFALELDRLHLRKNTLEIKKQALAKELEYALLSEFIATKKVDLFEKDLTRVERTLWVTEQDVKRAQDEFDTYKSEQSQIKNAYIKEISQLTNTREHSKDDEQIKVLDGKIAILDARQALIDARILQKELNAETVKIWYAIAQRRSLHDDADRARRLEFLNAKKTDIIQQIKTYETKNTTTTSSELSQVYASIIRTLSQTSDYLALVIQKLSSSSDILQRSAQAITIEGLKNFLTDSQFFVRYIATSITLAGSISAFAAGFKNIIIDANMILNIVFFLVIWLALYFASIILLPLLQQLLVRRKQRHGPSLALDLLLCCVQFVQKYLVSGLVWCVLFYAVRYDTFFAFSTQAKIIFYFISIIYLSYILILFRRAYNKCSIDILKKSFVRRFTTLIYVFLFATIMTYFLSEAFVTVVYGYSAFTRTLWALYSLMVRAFIVVLVLDKNLVLALIPNRGVWAMIRDRVTRYYYLVVLMVLALVILSDPFVGYGRLVSAVLEAVALTIVLAILLRFVYEFLRQYSSQIFFVSTDDAVRERFVHSKTWYVLFVVASLGTLVVGALLLFARIWGYPVAFATVGKFFNIVLGRVEGETAGSLVPITVRSIFELAAFVLGGVLLSSIFNRYVLQRLYSLTRVEAGVQNTISRISGYIFFVVPLIFGLQYVGLGAWNLWAVPILMFAVAWAGRGPADDFFAYFIILVEQSVKIGDFIRLDSPHSDISGVVRKITPRAVILRRRSSYAVIIPNSKLTRSTIYNWNYSHNYFGFDDMVITISYDSDPELVRSVLLKILSENGLILKSPVPVVRIESFAVNGYDVRIRGFLSTIHVLNQWEVRSDIRRAILKEFKARDIKLASPIQSIKLDTSRSGGDQ